MNTNSQRIAIATKLGWTQIQDSTPANSFGGSWHFKGYPPNAPTTGRKEYLPDYLGDLNVMHEAEKALLPDKNTNDNWAKYGEDWLWPKYVIILGETTKTSNISATAAERAEAWLKTFGLWTTDQVV